MAAGQTTNATDRKSTHFRLSKLSLLLSVGSRRDRQHQVMNSTRSLFAFLLLLLLLATTPPTFSEKIGIRAQRIDDERSTANQKHPPYNKTKRMIYTFFRLCSFFAGASLCLADRCPPETFSVPSKAKVKKGRRLPPHDLCGRLSAARPSKPLNRSLFFPHSRPVVNVQSLANKRTQKGCPPSIFGTECNRTTRKQRITIKEKKDVAKAERK